MKRTALLLLSLSALLFLFGCPMKPKQPLDTPADQSSQTTAQTGNTMSAEEQALADARNKVIEETIPPTSQNGISVTPSKPLTSQNLSNLQVIPFAYDQYLLSDEARNLISANAGILKSMTKVRVRLAGHCDERGSDQYNIALGERRAESVRSYLIELGIDASRIETVSFGEEQPVDPGHDENAWIKNRRVEFLILP